MTETPKVRFDNSILNKGADYKGFVPSADAPKDAPKVAADPNAGAPKSPQEAADADKKKKDEKEAKANGEEKKEEKKAEKKEEKKEAKAEEKKEALM